MEEMDYIINVEDMKKLHLQYISEINGWKKPEGRVIYHGLLVGGSKYKFTDNHLINIMLMNSIINYLHRKRIIVEDNYLLSLLHSLEYLILYPSKLPDGTVKDLHKDPIHMISGNNRIIGSCLAFPLLDAIISKKISPMLKNGKLIKEIKYNIIKDGKKSEKKIMKKGRNIKLFSDRMKIYYFLKYNDNKEIFDMLNKNCFLMFLIKKRNYILHGEDLDIIDGINVLFYLYLMLLIDLKDKEYSIKIPEQRLFNYIPQYNLFFNFKEYYYKYLEIKKNEISPE